MEGAEPRVETIGPVMIDQEEVLHFLGYPDGRRPTAKLVAMIDSAIDEARSLVRPRGVCQRLPVSRAAEFGLEPIEAEELVVGIVTVGADLERRATELQLAGESTRALILDAAGSAAAEESADRLGALVAGGKGRSVDGVDDGRFHLSCRVSPGYGQWPITAQAALFSVLPHEAIGVRLMPSMLMVPRKTISFAMWMGANERPLAGLSGCSRCDLPQCRYRRASSEGGP